MLKIAAFLSSFCLLGTLLHGLPARGAEPMRFVHPPPETISDQRHTYYWELLEAALASNRPQFGDYTVVSYSTPMNFQRAMAEVESGDAGRVNVIARATNLDLEKRLRPIPIPLDKGLLGYRLFLVMPDTEAKLGAVRTLDELKRFSIGQASPWTDVKVLSANGFRLVIADSYEGLFQMLGAHRFDLYSRGVNEIHAEWMAHRESVPGIMVDRALILQYPMPRYFFVPRTPQGERMAARITDGLNRLARSGEFARRYQAYKQLVLADVDLSGRRIFRVPNPQLSDLAPAQSDKRWWDDLATELAPRR